MTAYRVGIVGTGAIARTHALALRRLAEETGDVALVAAADTDPGRLSVFAAEFEVAAVYPDAEALLAGAGADIVHICTPPGVHEPMARAALEAGSHVVVEKPATLSLADLDRLIDAEEKYGRFVATVSQHRFGSGARRLQHLMRSGAAGRPLLARCDTTWFRDQAYFDVEWRGRWDTEGGGPTMGHGIHQIDLLLSILGEWTSVRGLARKQARVTETEDVSLAHVEFAGGAVASVVNSVVSPREESYLRFDFEYATVELTHLYGYTDADWRVTPAPGHERRITEAWESGPAGVRSEHLAQFREVVRSLREGTAPPVSTSDARSTLRLVAGIYASAFGGRPVRPDDLGPRSPFYERMRGDGPPWSSSRRTAERSIVTSDVETIPAQERSAETGLGLLHEYNRAVHVRWQGAELFRYVYRPWEPRLESPKPYFHPLRTLGGDLVSVYRPHDHVWHKGISWSLCNVGDQNFWGGPTYVRGEGYRQLDNNGTQLHTGFASLDASAERVDVVEELDWISRSGARLFTERRGFSVRVHPDLDAWQLSYWTAMRNTSGGPVAFGSPTTNGRADAGYSGLFWRGPRSFSGGVVVSPDGTGGDELMGCRAAWLGFVGKHDGAAGASTLVFAEHESNYSYPTKWFVRSGVFAAVCPAPFYDTEHEVAADDTLSLRYDVIIADGARDAGDCGLLAKRAGEAWRP
ncbi:DUF6807 family protein [Amycolatopsis suaedae]|uniref:DUF6807 family protein n=1 Tax=Amycolatopsis suaedae TaxID=2510978 RepID=UPI001F0F4E33|nr:DUF6807 family protein [Amycolatopsis suaedae]